MAWLRSLGFEAPSSVKQIAGADAGDLTFADLFAAFGDLVPGIELQEAP